MCTLLAGCATGTTGPSIGAGGSRPTQSVRTWQDIRQSQVVRQGWDLSCGSAALSTLLTHHLDEPTEEAAVVIWLLRRTDPVRVQSRGGFSLLDLKRFAESRGLRAEGYAGLTMPDLLAMGPAIVPVRVKGYDHFVVVRGIAGDRIVYADPAFGNLTRPAATFAEIWTSGIGFVVYPRGSTSVARHAPLPDELLLPDGTFTYRQTRSARVQAPGRRPQ